MGFRKLNFLNLIEGPVKKEIVEIVYGICQNFHKNIIFSCGHPDGIYIGQFLDGLDGLGVGSVLEVDAQKGDHFIGKGKGVYPCLKFEDTLVGQPVYPVADSAFGYPQVFCNCFKWGSGVFLKGQDYLCFKFIETSVHQGHGLLS